MRRKGNIFIREGFLLCLLLSFGPAFGQEAVDTALVEMARAEVKLYDLPRVDDLKDMGIIRSRYNTVYPQSWEVREGGLTNGEVLISLFVVPLTGREQKRQTMAVFDDENLRREMVRNNGTAYTGSSFFRTSAGKSVLRIDAYGGRGTEKKYWYLYFVLLDSSTLVSSTAVVDCSDRSEQSGRAEAEKYVVLFDAIVKNIARRR